MLWRELVCFIEFAELAKQLVLLVDVGFLEFLYLLTCSSLNFEKGMVLYESIAGELGLGCMVSVLRK